MILGRLVNIRLSSQHCSIFFLIQYSHAGLQNIKLFNHSLVLFNAIAANTGWVYMRGILRRYVAISRRSSIAERVAGRRAW